jgi:hypothetical protein
MKESRDTKGINQAISKVRFWLKLIFTVHPFDKGKV